MSAIPNYLEHFHNKIIVCNAGHLLNSKKNRHSIGFLKEYKQKDDSQIFEKIYSMDNLTVTARRKKLTMPKQISNELAYFVGYLQGDGCLTSDKKQIIFTDEYIEQINEINNLSKKLFGITGHIVLKKSKLSTKLVPNLEIKSIVLNSFLHHVFEINRGEKKNLKIPQLIKEDKQALKYYLGGLFDADGTLPKHPEIAKQLFIDITLKDKEFIEEIKNELQKIGIITLKIFERKNKSLGLQNDKICFELRIRRRDMLLKFLHELNFYHPNKSIRAKQMLAFLGR